MGGAVVLGEADLQRGGPLAMDDHGGNQRPADAEREVAQRVGVGT